MNHMNQEVSDCRAGNTESTMHLYFRGSAWNMTVTYERLSWPWKKMRHSGKNWKKPT